MRLAWPDAAHRDSVFAMAAAFALWFGALYAGSSWLSGWVPWRIVLATPWDGRIPFWPGAAWAYLSIVPMLCLAPFLLRTPARMRRLVHAAAIATLLGALCFVLLPLDATMLERQARSGSPAFRVADAMNLEHNYLPSLHVALALLCALAYGPGASPAWRWLLALWVLAIAASTVLIRQHYLVDVVAGVGLAAGCWALSGQRAGTSRWLHAVEVELLCLANFARFSLRHRRYAFISLALLATSFPRFGSHRLQRTGFAFLQAVDDLLDGDRPSMQEPLLVSERLVHGLESGDFSEDDLSRLGAAFREDLLQRGGSDALAQAIALLRVMQADRVRVRDGLLLDEPALHGQLHDTFRHSVDLMLLAAGSPVRSGAVPGLIAAFAWCSVVRDLDEDLARGLVNLPRGVVEAAAIRDLRDPAEVRGNAVVAAWLASEARRAAQALDAADAQVAALHDRHARRLLAMFARSIRRYLGRFPARGLTGTPQSSAISG